jgi:hypothetical protein
MSSVPGQLNIGQVTGSGGANNLVGVFNGAITIGGKDDSNRTFRVFLITSSMNITQDDPQKTSKRLSTPAGARCFSPTPIQTEKISLA